MFDKLRNCHSIWQTYLKKCESNCRIKRKLLVFKSSWILFTINTTKTNRTGKEKEEMKLSKIKAGVIGVGPVSYTHLDVYKRQGIR